MHFRIILFVTFCLFIAKNIQAANLPEQLLTMPITLDTGEVVTLKQYQGKKPVYLKFWATWCQPCLKQMPHFEHVAQQYGEGLQVIAINLGLNDTAAAVAKVKNKYGLSMAMATDNSGDLARAFRLLGTPYHLLFDKQVNLVHIGHEADSVVDNKLALITQEKPLEYLAHDTLLETNETITLAANTGKIQALFFTATWCDWYLETSRPQLSQQCRQAPKVINKLAIRFHDANWQGVISRLWTGQAELNVYQKKYSLAVPAVIDASNGLFHQFNVKDLPSLLVVKEDQVLYRTTDFSNPVIITHELNKALSR